MSLFQQYYKCKYYQIPVSFFFLSSILLSLDSISASSLNLSFSLSFVITSIDSWDIIELCDSYILSLEFIDVIDNYKLSKIWTFAVNTTPSTFLVIQGASGLGSTILALKSERSSWSNSGVREGDYI